jgi:tetratricopeptide (TPR) repeat protein/Zn finger protein HypA/HybF involved in hydrogenase expression
VDIGKLGTQSDKNIDELLASIAEGKDVKPDIFEDIKNISRNGESTAEEEAPAEATEFECPVCGARVEADATQCPGCGAQFAEEAPAEKFECPLCSAQVDANAARCPSCGVEFEEDAQEAKPEPAPAVRPPSATRQAAEEEVERALETVTARPPSRPAGAPGPPVSVTGLSQRVRVLAAKEFPIESLEGVDKKTLYKELPRIVNEVKPLLLSAKKIGVSIEDSKQLINDAIAFGKKKEMEKAVRLVSQAKASLEKAFTVELANQIESLLAEVDKARASGSTVGTIETHIAEAVTYLEAARYSDVSNRIAEAKNEFSARAGGYYRAKEALQAALDLVEDSVVVGVEAGEAKRAIARADDALQRRKWEQSELEAGRARDIILKQLPKYLDKEMKKARDMLLEMKVGGGDLTKPIGILKQASIHLKRGEYADAVHYVKLFREEVRSP